MTKRSGSAARARWHCSQRKGLRPVAVAGVDEIFKRDRQKEALGVFGTDDPEHPGVGALQEAGDFCLAGPVRVLRLPEHDDFLEYRLTPAQTREEFARRGWRTVVGFQTRNPIHRAHEYIQKCALEIVDGLLVHPLVGATKGDDVPAEVRMRCYEALVRGLLPEGSRHGERVPCRDALRGSQGSHLARDRPQELRVHALHRRARPRGRRHYYGTYDAQRIFERVRARTSSASRPLMFEHSFWCNRCEGMASPKTCPHGEERPGLALGHQGARDAARRGAAAHRVQSARGRRHPDRGDARPGRVSPRAAVARQRTPRGCAGSATAR